MRFITFWNYDLEFVSWYWWRTCAAQNYERARGRVRVFYSSRRSSAYKLVSSRPSSLQVLWFFWSGVSGPLQEECCFMRGARNVSLCWEALVYNVSKLNRSCIEIPRGIPFVSKWRWMILKFIKASSWINGSIKPIVSLCLCHTSFACAKKWHKVLWPEPFSYLSIDSGANSNLHSLSSPINTLSSWILPSHSSGQKI